MWVCKNLATGEYLKVALVLSIPRHDVFDALVVPTRDLAQEFLMMEEAAEWCFLVCEEFGIEGFEPVSDDPAVTWESDPHWLGRGQE